MKFALALFAVLAAIGLGQAHKVPDFGKGPLHEDIQDILDLIPMDEIAEVFLDYLAEDVEFQTAAKRLESSNVLKDLTVDVEAIPEVINFLNFLQKEGIEIYDIVNKINKIFGIKELVPPASYMYRAKPMQRSGGVAGFFKDIKILFNYDDFIRIYVHKMKTSEAFGRFVQQLKSNNFQQIVNKVYYAKSFQLILNGLKQYGVHTRIVADIMYIVLGITVPRHPLPEPDRTLDDELADFLTIIPVGKFAAIIYEYATQDEKVQAAATYLLTRDSFQKLLREVETVSEFKALIVFLENSGLHVIDAIQEFHRVIGMEEYVPPKIKDMFKFKIRVQKVGEGLTAMFNDLIAEVPMEKIKALYDEKMKTDNAFSTFVKKVTSPEMKELISNLYGNVIYQDLLEISLRHGLDLKAVWDFFQKLIPFAIPTPVLF